MLLLMSTDFFFFKIDFQNTIRVSNSLNPGQNRLDVGPNNLHPDVCYQQMTKPLERKAFLVTVVYPCRIGVSKTMQGHTEFRLCVACQI